MTPVSFLLIKLFGIHHDSLFDIIYSSILLDNFYLRGSVERKCRCMHGQLMVFGSCWVKCALNQISVQDLRVRGFWELLGMMSIVREANKFQLSAYVQSISTTGLKLFFPVCLIFYSFFKKLNFHLKITVVNILNFSLHHHSMMIL